MASAHDHWDRWSSFFKRRFTVHPFRSISLVSDCKMSTHFLSMELTVTKRRILKKLRKPTPFIFQFTWASCINICYLTLATNTSLTFAFSISSFWYESSLSFCLCFSSCSIWDSKYASSASVSCLLRYSVSCCVSLIVGRCCALGSMRSLLEEAEVLFPGWPSSWISVRWIWTQIQLEKILILSDC